MEKELQHELIERYLADALPEAEKLEVENRLAHDAEFRAELALHRALQQHLGDSGEMRLRAALDDILAPAGSDPSSARPTTRRGWLWSIGLGGLLVLIGLVGWYWRAGAFSGPPQTTPEQVQPQKTAPDDPQKVLPPAIIPKKEDRKPPIAMADPADFTPNPALDARIGGVRGNEEEAVVELISPAPESELLLQQGRITLVVECTVTADSLSAKRPFRLFIYSNHPKDWENKQALYNLPFPLDKKEPDRYQVAFRRQLRLKPGLYYLVVGQQRGAESDSGYRTLWVGKMTVKSGSD